MRKSGPFSPAAAVGGALCGAIDLGTNNCRLLVARPNAREFRVVDSFSRIVRLGEGLAASGRLSERAMARAIAALRRCKTILERRRVRALRCVATEACRRAANGAAFLDEVRATVGLEFEVLEHEEEARLALLGCLPLIDPRARQLLMIDIGGGSTEVLWIERDARGGAREVVFSMPMGVVTLAESHCRPSADARAYRAMVESANEAFGALERRHRLAERIDARAVQMLGTSGTVTTLAAVHLGLNRYDRRRVDGVELSFSTIAAVSADLRRLDDRERRRHPCIGAGRADLVVAGCAILDAAHRSWPVERLRVADRGVREGLLNRMMGRSLGDAVSAPAA